MIHIVGLTASEKKMGLGVSSKSSHTYERNLKNFIAKCALKIKAKI